MKRILFLIIVLFIFSGCYDKPDETFTVNNTTLKIIHRSSFVYVYSQTKYGWKQEMSFEKDLNVTKDDIIKILQLKQEEKI